MARPGKLRLDDVPGSSSRPTGWRARSNGPGRPRRTRGTALYLRDGPTRYADPPPPAEAEMMDHQLPEAELDSQGAGRSARVRPGGRSEDPGGRQPAGELGVLPAMADAASGPGSRRLGAGDRELPAPTGCWPSKPSPRRHGRGQPASRGPEIIRLSRMELASPGARPSRQSEECRSRRSAQPGGKEKGQGKPKDARSAGSGPPPDDSGSWSANPPDPFREGPLGRAVYRPEACPLSVLGTDDLAPAWNSTAMPSSASARPVPRWLVTFVLLGAVTAQSPPGFGAGPPS